MIKNMWKLSRIAHFCTVLLGFYVQAHFVAGDEPLAGLASFDDHRGSIHADAATETAEINMTARNIINRFMSIGSL